MSNTTNTLTTDDLVRREVVLCVSHLVSELQARAEDFPEYYDDLIALAFGPADYEEAARDAGWEKDPETRPGFRNPTSGSLNAAPTWQALCAQQDIEVYDYQREVFEHWVVSRHLAVELVRHGETVVENILGIGPVWARTTTGQAIFMDGVIEEIYNERLESNT